MILRGLCASPSYTELLTQPPALRISSRVRASWLVSCLPALFVLFAIAAQAQRYDKIVVFGDSLSDTGNDALLMQAQYGFPFPSPFMGNQYLGLYTLGRFTDGPDTFPPSFGYYGVWVEELARALPAHPQVRPSLLGGTDYAYGYANTYDGTTPLTFTVPYTINVLNVRQQIEQYLAANPHIDNHTLFIVWGGANNLTEAALTQPTLNDMIVAADDGATEQAGNIQLLINAGATQFLIPNVPDLGMVPRFNGGPYSGLFTVLSEMYNGTLAGGVAVLPAANPTKNLTINTFDVFGLLHQIVNSPGSYGLLDVTAPSQSEWVNPDTHLFWDDLHPTTHGHFLLGEGALEAIEPPGCVMVMPSGRYAGSTASGCR